MFNFRKLQTGIEDNKRKVLEAENTELARQVESIEAQLSIARTALRVAENKAARATHDRELEDEKLEHRIKIKEEKNELELTKKKAILEAEYHEKLEKVKDDYRDKLEDVLKDQIKSASESHDKLMAHMPKIEAMFGNQPVEKKD